MHVAFIVPESGGGGIATFYRHLVRVLADMAVDVSIIVADPFRLGSVPDWASSVQTATSVTQAEFEEANRDFGHLLGFNNLRRNLAVAWAAWRKLSHMNHVDIVEVTDWPSTFVPACVSQDRPYIVQGHASVGQLAEHDPQPGHDLEETLVQLMELQLLCDAHRIQSSSVQNSTFWEYSLGRDVGTIRPAFELPNGSPEAGEADGNAIVLGRLQRWKGPHVLCEALRLLGPAAPRVDWYGAAKPWGQTGISAERHLATEFPGVWGQSFRHHPPVRPDLAGQILSRAQFSVVPSTWDVFNFVVVESMAAGRPTIVSKGAGASELITHGENGLLFESGDAAGLAEAIETVLSMSKSRRREIGNSARETVRIELDPERVAKIRLEAFQEAIEAFREHPPAKPHEWTINLTPRHGHRRSPNESANSILESFPQRMIAGHLVRRLAKRISPT